MKEIDHVHVRSRWRLVHICSVFLASGFLVTTLKIRLKSRIMAPSKQVPLDVRRLRDEDVCHEYKRKLVKCLGKLNYFNDPWKFWSDFKTKILKVLESCLSM